jgi:hypothetical protein
VLAIALGVLAGKTFLAEIGIIFGAEIGSFSVFMPDAV